MSEEIRYINTASTPGGTGITNEITGANRAYAGSLEWEAAEEKNLSVLKINHFVYAVGSEILTSRLIFSSWGDSENYKLTFSGNWSGPVYDSSKFNITSPLDDSLCNSYLSYLIFKNVQLIINSPGESWRHTIRSAPSHDLNNCKFINCLCINPNQTPDSMGFILTGAVNIIQNTEILNCLFINHTAISISLRSDNALIGNCKALNNTIYGDNCLLGLEVFPGAAIASNNLIFNCLNDIWGEGNILLSNNATEDGDQSGIDGNITITQTADNFAALVKDAAGGDFRLTDENSQAFSAGKDLSAYFTDDITGRTRAQWSIGAFDYFPPGFPVGRLKKNLISGYHVFLNQYLKSKVEGLDPLKKPDGSVFDD